jgi:hypothetical protein
MGGERRDRLIQSGNDRRKLKRLFEILSNRIKIQKDLAKS